MDSTAAERIDARERKVTRAYRDGYSAKEAMAIAGITYRQLDHWCREGYVRPTMMASRGSGHARRYSVRDVVMLKLAGQLVRAGLSPACMTDVQRATADVDEVNLPHRFVVIDEYDTKIITELELTKTIRCARGPVTVAAIPDPDEVAMT